MSDSEPRESDINLMQAPVVLCALSAEAVPQLAKIELLSNPSPWDEAAFSSHLSKAGAFILGARLAGELAGYVACSAVLDEGHIENFAVHPQRRRLGVGRLLITECLQRMGSQGISAAFLEVRAGNAAALALYRAVGFIEDGRRVGYYRPNGEDALLMRCEVPPSSTDTGLIKAGKAFTR